MIKAIIRFSVRNKLIIGLMVIALITGGIYSAQRLPIDAVPDITNNQVQVVTVSTSLAPQEVEQFITYPVEVAMANIPRVIEIRSISRFGLSVVTIVFEEGMPVLDARQFVKEQIGIAEQQIPPELGQPELMPITTGLGEIYQYVLEVEPGYEEEFDPMRLRTIQDWIVKRQLAGIPGIIEVSSFGGNLKQYEVALDPLLLQSYDIAIPEVYEALSMNNQNTGGSYISKQTNAYYIRTEGIVQSLDDIEQIVVAQRSGSPVLIRDVGTVGFGSPKRYGAMTMDGKGEAVGGITLMLRGANSSAAITNVHERVEQVRKSLPEGVLLTPYLDRSDLVAEAIHTVEKNLMEGGLIVIVVLILLLGNWRAGLIVASVIPLALLFALIMMRQFGVSANLMSLGAIDFGIVVDGAVIIVEGVLFALVSNYAGQRLSQSKMDNIIIDSASQLFQSAVFGVFIILVVFIPVMTLTGIEGKMFRPMALTFSFAILGALILSLTYVPMLSSLLLQKKIQGHDSWSDRVLVRLQQGYLPVLRGALRLPYVILGLALAVLVGAVLLFRTLGAEFIPTLEEGDLAMQMTIQPGSSLDESIRTSTKAERILLDRFPEVTHVVSKIGTAEVPTDPMAVEDGDIMIILKPRSEWESAGNREELVKKMKEALSVVVGASFEFTQPIQLRFNELMTGAKSDIAIKIFGENNDVLKELADEAEPLIARVPGAADVRVDQTQGLPQLMITYDRAGIAEYGLHIEDLNTIVRAAYAGETAGTVYENERTFDLVVRLQEQYREDVNLDRLFIRRPNGKPIPLSEVAEVRFEEGPLQISREGTRRRINIGVNVRGRDVASLVDELQNTLEQNLDLPPGYALTFGGEFENLQRAQRRLSLAVPAALGLIFVLLFFTFGKLKYALMIFSAVPLAAIGGVVALWVRGMPFSISAGVGFIALFGVAVLNGIVLISRFNEMWYTDDTQDLKAVIMEGALTRLRPVLMTATVAALGFLPMAISTSNGAEVQKPLATVVIGGLITATLLTLVVLPIFYYLVNRRSIRKKAAGAVAILLLVGLPGQGLLAQAETAKPLSLNAAIDSATFQHPILRTASVRVRQAELGVNQARQLPPLNTSLQLGQIDGNLIDYNLSITQSLGQIGADKQRKEMARQGIEVARSQQEQLEYQLVYEVTKAWYNWTYQEARLRRLAALRETLDSVLAKTNLQLQTGAINRLDQTLVRNQRTRLDQDLAEARVAIESAVNELRQRAWLNGRSWTTTETYEALPQPAELVAQDLLIAPQQEQVVMEQLRTRVREKELGPSFHVGYFNQSLRPRYSLMGIITGVQIPIFRKAGEARIQEQQLEQIAAQHQLERVQGELARSVEGQSRQVQIRRDALDIQGSDLREEASVLRDLATRQLESGDIDYFQYVQALEAALRNELDYLDLIHAYNQAVIDLHFFIR